MKKKEENLYPRVGVFFINHRRRRRREHLIASHLLGVDYAEPRMVKSKHQ